MKTE
jgi:hypothetical protein